jgi:hypothetical protein
MRVTRRPTIAGINGIEEAAPLAPPPAFSPATGRVREPRGDGDRVELSEGARVRQRLRAEIGDIDGVDEARVASLRARVVADAYAPPPSAVAARLVGERTADLVV